MTPSSFVTLHSTDLPPDQRFDWWCDLISHDVAPIRVTSEHAADFRASAGAIDLDTVQLTTMEFPALSSVRTPALIRRSDPERYELALIVGSEMWISQGGKDTLMGAGDLVMWETSHPYEGGALDGPVPAQAIIVHLPRSGLPLPSGKVDTLVASRMPSGGGIGAILASYLRTLVREAPSMALQEAKQLGAATLDLALAFLAHLLNAHDRLQPETRQLALMAQIRAFVEHNCNPPAEDRPVLPPVLERVDWRPACVRHDFGYRRNYRRIDSFDCATKSRLDVMFLQDMRYACDRDVSALSQVACYALARIYYFAVRRFGGQ